MDLDAIQGIFFQECDEGLAGMEANFALLRAGDREPETINGVFRCVHSIKGGAGAFGHERLQAYTHHYETLLDNVRNGTLTLTPDLLDLVMGAFDLLADHVAAARDGTDVPADAGMLELLAAASGGAGHASAPLVDIADATDAPVAAQVQAPTDDFDDLMAFLDDVAPASDDVDNSAADNWRLDYRPTANALDNGGEPVLLLRELSRMGARVIDCDRSTLPGLDALDPEIAYFSWTLSLPASVAEDDIRAVFEFTDACAITLSPPARWPAPTATKTVPGCFIRASSQSAQRMLRSVSRTLPTSGVSFRLSFISRASASGSPSAQSLTIAAIVSPALGISSSVEVRKPICAGSDRPLKNPICCSAVSSPTTGLFAALAAAARIVSGPLAGS